MVPLASLDCSGPEGASTRSRQSWEGGRESLSKPCTRMSCECGVKKPMFCRSNSIRPLRRFLCPTHAKIRAAIRPIARAVPMAKKPIPSAMAMRAASST